MNKGLNKIDEQIKDYLSWRIPQLENLKIGIQQANDGDFATEEEVQAMFNKYL